MFCQTRLCGHHSVKVSFLHSSPPSERALKRVQELLKSLAIAKGHLKQCGGVSEDDLEQQRLQVEHQRYKCTFGDRCMCTCKPIPHICIYSVMCSDEAEREDVHTYFCVIYAITLGLWKSCSQTWRVRGCVARGLRCRLTG